MKAKQNTGRDKIPDLLLQVLGPNIASLYLLISSLNFNEEYTQ